MNRNFHMAHTLLFEGKWGEGNDNKYYADKCDERDLSIKMEMFCLSKERAVDLTQRVALFVESFLGDSFVSQLTVPGSKNNRIPLAERFEDVRQNDASYWCFYGNCNVKGPGMKLKKDLINCEKKYFMLEPYIANRNHEDFVRSFNSLFPEGRPADDVLLKNTYELFQMQGKVFRNHFYGPDLTVVFVFGKHKKKKDLYCGSFHLSINATVIKNCLDEISLEFADFLKEISSEYQNVNGFVMLQPSERAFCESYYKLYFKDYWGDDDYDEELFTENEGRKYTYLQGVEWANVMSPVVLERGSDWENVPTGIKTSKIKEAMYVQSETPISQYDVPQAILLKQYLLPGLYPGRSIWRIRGMFENLGTKLSGAPRKEWEIVPILPGEISVSYTNLVFTAKNCT